MEIKKEVREVEPVGRVNVVDLNAVANSVEVLSNEVGAKPREVREILRGLGEEAGVRRPLKTRIFGCI
jgi:hypothetical protein